MDINLKKLVDDILKVKKYRCENWADINQLKNELSTLLLSKSWASTKESYWVASQTIDIAEEMLKSMSEPDDDLWKPILRLAFDKALAQPMPDDAGYILITKDIDEYKSLSDQVTRFTQLYGSINEPKDSKFHDTLSTCITNCIGKMNKMPISEIVDADSYNDKEALFVFLCEEYKKSGLQYLSVTNEGQTTGATPKKPESAQPAKQPNVNIAKANAAVQTQKANMQGAIAPSATNAQTPATDENTESETEYHSQINEDSQRNNPQPNAVQSTQPSAQPAVNQVQTAQPQPQTKSTPAQVVQQPPANLRPVAKKNIPAPPPSVQNATSMYPRPVIQGDTFEQEETFFDEDGNPITVDDKFNIKKFMKEFNNCINDLEVYKKKKDIENAIESEAQIRAMIKKFELQKNDFESKLPKNKEMVPVYAECERIMTQTKSIIGIS